MNGTVNGALREVVHRPHQGVFFFLLSKCAVVLHTRKCNFFIEEKCSFPSFCFNEIKKILNNYMHTTSWLPKLRPLHK